MNPACFIAGVLCLTSSIDAAKPSRVLAWQVSEQVLLQASTSTLSPPTAGAGQLAQTKTAGAATHVVSGHVLDEESRAPLAGAEVHLTRSLQQPIDLQQLTSQRVRADGEGRFVIVGVTPGRYVLRAQLAGYARRTSRTPPMTVVVGPDERDIVVELGLTQSAGLSGRVLTAEGRPAAGVALFVRQEEPGPPGQRRRLSPVANAYADDDGVFRVDDLPPGDYFVQAVVPVVPAPGPALTLPGDIIHLPTYFSGAADADAASPVSATRGSTTDIGILQMLSAPAFRVSGTVIDGVGRALAHVMVRLVPADAPAGALPMSPRARTVTDSAGVFAIEGVLNGRYQVVAVPAVDIAGAAPASAGTESSSYRLGGSRPDTLRGSVLTETRQGVTRQYRDEFAVMAPIAVDNAPVTGLVLTLQGRR